MSEQTTDGNTQSDTAVASETAYEYDPITCDDCGEIVVVTRDPEPRYADDEIRFECECSIGSVGAVKPESWTGGSFL